MDELCHRARLGGFWRRREGAAAVEFALIGPLLLLLLCGILSYGGVFWTAHSVQQLANDAARAAIAGLDDDERLALARGAVAEEIETLGPFDPLNAAVSAERAGQSFTVRVSYDASRSAFWALSGLVPMPSAQVTRSATIRLGGF